MKIRSLTICNFKNYQGEQTLSFQSDDPKRNIVLIGGCNGAGKTTLFEAIKLCMFGYQYDGIPLSKSQYEQYIRSSWNHRAVQEHDRRYYISMEIVLDDVYPSYTITLRRSWDAFDNSFTEDFLILRDGHAFEIVEKENWQQCLPQSNRRRTDPQPPQTL
jgi:DNA sulfur modification protein DndD